VTAGVFTLKEDSDVHAVELPAEPPNLASWLSPGPKPLPKIVTTTSPVEGEFSGIAMEGDGELAKTDPAAAEDCEPAETVTLLVPDM